MESENICIIYFIRGCKRIKFDIRLRRLRSIARYYKKIALIFHISQQLLLFSYEIGWFVLFCPSFFYFIGQEKIKLLLSTKKKCFFRNYIFLIYSNNYDFIF